MGKGDKKLVTKGMPPENFRCAKCDGGDKNGDELRRWGDPASKGGEGGLLSKRTRPGKAGQEVPLELRRSQPGKMWGRAFQAEAAASPGLFHTFLSLSFKPVRPTPYSGQTSGCGPLLST